MQAKIKYMWRIKVDHIIIITSSDSTVASRKTAANSAKALDKNVCVAGGGATTITKLEGACAPCASMVPPPMIYIYIFTLMITQSYTWHR